MSSSTACAIGERGGGMPHALCLQRCNLPHRGCLRLASLQVWEEMNRAYANHEVVADFSTAAFFWFESG